MQILGRLFGFKAKSRLTEGYAASYFLMSMREAAANSWTALDQFLESGDGSSLLDDDDRTVLEPHYLIACTSVEAQAIPILFPSAQALRIRQWVIDLIRESAGEQAVAEFSAYDEAWQEALQYLPYRDRAPRLPTPDQAVAERMLREWLGKDSALAALAVASSFPTGLWKILKEGCVFIEGGPTAHLKETPELG